MSNQLTEADLEYAAYMRCLCGAGMAYRKGITYWDCSDILLGQAKQDVKHTEPHPFTFWKITSEGESRANGATTRPKGSPKLKKPETHREEHVAHICIRQESDFPNSPIDIHRPKEQQNWWDITFVVLVQDDKPIDVVIADWRKSL